MRDEEIEDDERGQAAGARHSPGIVCCLRLIRMRLLLACAVSAAVVLAAPFMGRLQSFLRASISTRAYVLLLGAVVGGRGAHGDRRGVHRASRRTAGAASRPWPPPSALALVYTSMLSTGDPDDRRRRARALRRVRVDRGAVLSRLAAGRRCLDPRAADPVRLHRRHARRVAAVVHSVSRRRDARRLAQLHRAGRAACCLASRSNHRRPSRGGRVPTGGRASAWRRRQRCSSSAPSSAWCIWATCCTSTASALLLRVTRSTELEALQRDRSARWLTRPAAQHSAPVSRRSVSR